MKRDEMLGYVIKALRNKKYSEIEITKIIYQIEILENEMKPNKAREEYYEFIPKEKED